MSVNQLINNHYKYKAFISYKHSKSREQAISLENSLKLYAKPDFRLPIKIFRDEKHIKAGENLPEKIKNALSDSEFMLYMTSPEAAESTWIIDEITYWFETLDRKEKFIIVHDYGDINFQLQKNDKKIDWKSSDAFPSILKNYIDYLPLIVDLSWAREMHQRTFENGAYEDKINLISATLRGIEPEELKDYALRVTYKNRRNRRRRNILLSSVSVMLLISLIFVLFLRIQVENKNVELRVNNGLLDETNNLLKYTNDSLNKTTSRLDTTNSKLVKSNTDLTNQMILTNLQKDRATANYIRANALLGLFQENPVLTYSSVSYLLSRRNLTNEDDTQSRLLLVQSLINGLAYQLGKYDEIIDVEISKDAKYLATIVGGYKNYDNRTLIIFSLISGRRLGQINGQFTAVAFSNDGRQLIVGNRENHEAVLDIFSENLEFQNRIEFEPLNVQDEFGESFEFYPQHIDDIAVSVNENRVAVSGSAAKPWLKEMRLLSSLWGAIIDLQTKKVNSYVSPNLTLYDHSPDRIIGRISQSGMRSVSFDNNEVYVHTIEQSTLIGHHTAKIDDITISPDGQVIAVAGHSDILTLFYNQGGTWIKRGFTLPESIRLIEFADINLNPYFRKENIINPHLLLSALKSNVENPISFLDQWTHWIQSLISGQSIDMLNQYQYYVYPNEKFVNTILNDLNSAIDRGGIGFNNFITSEFGVEEPDSTYEGYELLVRRKAIQEIRQDIFDKMPGVTMLIAMEDFSLGTLFIPATSLHEVYENGIYRSFFRQLGNHKDKINDIALLKDGTWALSASSDKEVKAWKINGAFREHTFQGSKSPIWYVYSSFSSDKFAYHGSDRQLHLASLDNGINTTIPGNELNIRHEYQGGSRWFTDGFVNNADWGEDDQILISTNNGLIQLHKDDSVTKTLVTDSGASSSLTPDSKWVLIDINTVGNDQWGFENHFGFVMISLDREDHISVVTSEKISSKNFSVNGTWAEVDSSNNMRLVPITEVNSRIIQGCFSDDGEYYAGILNNELMVWKSEGAPIEIIHLEADITGELSFSTDNSKLAVPIKEDSLIVLDLIKSSFLEMKRCTNVYDWKNENVIVSGLEDGSVILCDCQTESSVSLGKHPEKIIDIDVSRNGDWILTSSLDNTIRIWDFEGNYASISGLQNPASVIRFNKDDSKILFISGFAVNVMISPSAPLKQLLTKTNGKTNAKYNAITGSFTTTQFKGLR